MAINLTRLTNIVYHKCDSSCSNAFTSTHFLSIEPHKDHLKKLTVSDTTQQDAKKAFALAAASFDFELDLFWRVINYHFFSLSISNFSEWRHSWLMGVSPNQQLSKWSMDCCQNFNCCPVLRAVAYCHMAVPWTEERLLIVAWASLHECTLNAGHQVIGCYPIAAAADWA